MSSIELDLPPVMSEIVAGATRATRAVRHTRATRAAWVVLAISAAAAAFAPTEAGAQEPLKVGERPEAAALETLEGEPIQLEDLIGERPVVLEFWATWCPVCRALEPKMLAAEERFGDRVDFLVIAVGVGQTPQSIRAHLRRHPQPGRVLWDARGAAVRAFSAPGTGIVFILDEDGEVVYQGAGSEQDLEGVLAELLAR